MTITAEDVRVYTEAQCWVLAWHLAQLLGDRARIMDFDEHVLVQLDDADRYLDVTGIHTKAELCETWEFGCRLRPIAYDLSKHILSDNEHPENVRACATARALILQYLPKEICL